MPASLRCRTWALALLCLAPLAHADEDEGGRRTRAAPLPQYQQECGACHVAYPARFLPAASWQRVMGGLAQHHGSDASLDAATTRQIGAWLVANAGSAKRQRTAPPDDRITRSDWFLREHDELSASTFKRAAIQSASNCAACHVHADQGSFNEHDVRIPR